MTEDIVYRLRKRAEIRRQIKDRRSVQEGQPDRLAELLEEAAAEIEALRADAQEEAWRKVTEWIDEPGPLPPKP